MRHRVLARRMCRLQHMLPTAFLAWHTALAFRRSRSGRPPYKTHLAQPSAQARSPPHEHTAREGSVEAQEPGAPPPDIASDASTPPLGVPRRGDAPRPAGRAAAATKRTPDDPGQAEGGAGHESRATPDD